MECKKDKAKKAMDIAEKKISENDYNGAKKFVENAQTLYPKLDGLEQMSMIILVFIAASNKINTVEGGEETDWYAILGVDPLADEEAVKKQYKKLALLLHPDKNKFKGAEDAFKLVLEAWCLLSDEARRTAYDQKRTLNEVKKEMQKPPNPQKPAAASSNGNQNAGDGVDPSANATSHKPAPAPASKVGTFWTLCNGCNSLCEYLRDRYLNRAIRCPNCDKTFVATENNFWGKIMSEVDLRLSLLRQKATNRNTNGASSFGTGYQPGSGTTQEPPNAYKPASSTWNQNANPAPAPVNPSKESRGGYFWTLCNGCQSLCEYRRDRFLNRVIHCPNCGQAFIATENNLWGKIMREVGYTHSLVIQQQQQQSSAQNTSGATYYSSASPQQQQQQWSAENTSGGTYNPSSSGSFHQNCSASVPANAANETLETLKRILERLDQVLAAAVVGFL